MQAVTNTIIGTVVPPEDKIGSIHLPPSRNTHTLTQGACLELVVTHIGPDVEDVEVGMTISVDPNPVASEDRFFNHKGTDYAAVPEEYFDWKEATGFLFGLYDGIKPLGTRIILKRDQQDESSPGGIIIPEVAQEKSDGGTVVALGSTSSFVQVGASVRFKPFAGTDVERDGTKYVVLDESDLIAVCKESE